MKILYCIAGTCHSGGMERVLANKANYLVAHGYEVVIVTTDQQGQPPFFALDQRIRCIDLGINYASMLRCISITEEDSRIFEYIKKMIGYGEIYDDHCNNLQSKSTLEENYLNETGKINYHAFKPVLFEFPTYEYLETGEVLGKCLSFKEGR